MFKLIPLLLIGSGIYIGVQYNDELVAILGQDGIEQIEEFVNAGMEQLLDKLKEMTEYNG